jgi:DnaJ-domain-containing protein 1
MRDYLAYKKENQESNRSISKGCFPFVIILVIALLIGVSLSDKENKAAPIILLALTIIFLITVFILLMRKPFKLDNTEKRIILLFISFFRSLHFTQSHSLEILSTVFKNHKLQSVLLFFEENFEKDLNIISAARNLTNEAMNARYFALYVIMDIAARDGIFSLQEEDLIHKVYRSLQINKSSFIRIKNDYLKQGIKEERVLNEEANKRKGKLHRLTPHFLAQAYKILGISPNMSKDEVKKVYRRLAKQYHPDTLQGESAEVIQICEERFRKITLAYELIMEFKNI